MFQFAGIEIPEAGAAETESTDPAVPLRVIDIGCGTGGAVRWGSERVPDWQEHYMEKLTEEYVKLLTSQGHASDHF